MQTTFLNAFRGLQRGTTTHFEQAWLYKIAQNVCIARRSSSGRRLKLEAPDDFEVLQEVVPSAGPSPDGDTLELMGLEDALDSMPENQRRAILLREWQGLSYREIATELGLSQGAVEMLIFRARRTLAMALERPEVADKRRTGKAKASFSLGSLVAAMKSLFSTSAALKMTAVAVSAAVVGTGAVHSVVQHVTPQIHSDAAGQPAPREVVRESIGGVPVANASAVLLSQRKSHASVAVGGKLAATSPGPSVAERTAVVQADASSPSPLAPIQTSPPPTSAGSTLPAPSVAPTAAAVTTDSSSSGAPSATTNPSPPPSGDGGSHGSSSGMGSGGSGGPIGGDGGHRADHGAADAAGKPHPGGDPKQPKPPMPSTTATTPTDTTTTASDTTTTSDPVDLSIDPSTTVTTQSTTDPAAATTTTTSGAGGSSSSDPSDNHHGNGGGGGGGGHGH